MLGKIPLKLNVTITGPFRALIATAKSFKDPRQSSPTSFRGRWKTCPGITTEVRRVEEQQQQTQTPVPSKVARHHHPNPSEKMR